MMLLGLVGDPVEHSLSPLLHQRALRALGERGCYHVFRVPPGRLREAIRGLACLGFKGANVTLPHKQDVLSCADRISETARILGAANVLSFEDGLVHADNVDAPAMQRRIEKSGALSKSRGGLVLGAGGAARAAVWALARAGAVRVAVASRNPDHARALCDALRPASGPTELQAIALAPEPLRPALHAAEVVINATPLGLQGGDPSPFPDELWGAQPGWALDLTYRRSTAPPFLQAARRAGWQGEDGLPTLVAQGLLSLERWLARPVPAGLDVRLHAALACLGGQP